MLFVHLLSCARMESLDGGVDQDVVSKLRSSLESVEKELRETKGMKASLERECVIYQSQLDVSVSSEMLVYSEIYTNINIYGVKWCPNFMAVVHVVDAVHICGIPALTEGGICI